MAFPIVFLALLLLQSAIASTEDAFESFDPYSPEEENEIDSYMDRKARNDKFLRFGRRFWDYDTGNDNIVYDDSEVQRPPRTGRQEKNDQFIRFGRSKEDFLRLNGNPQQRTIRDKSSFLRFGRSITEENKKKRGKRGVTITPSSDALKRHESYLRFGRNSNFMRFGRNLGHPSVPSHSIEEAFLKQMSDSRNEQMLNYLRNLLKESRDNFGHNSEN